MPAASGIVDIAGAGAAMVAQGGKNGLSWSLHENGPVASQTNPGAVFTQTLGDGVSQHVFTAHASSAAQSEFCVHALNSSQAWLTPHKAAPDASLKHRASWLSLAGAANEVGIADVPPGQAKPQEVSALDIAPSIVMADGGTDARD